MYSSPLPLLGVCPAFEVCTHVSLKKLTEVLQSKLKNLFQIVSDVVGIAIRVLVS